MKLFCNMQGAFKLHHLLIKHEYIRSTLNTENAKSAAVREADL